MTTKRVEQYEFTISSNHFTCASFTENVRTKDLQYLLLNGHETIIRHGQLCHLKHKTAGPGIHTIWYEHDNTLKTTVHP